MNHESSVSDYVAPYIAAVARAATYRFRTYIGRDATAVEVRVSRPLAAAIGPGWAALVDLVASADVPVVWPEQPVPGDTPRQVATVRSDMIVAVRAVEGDDWYEVVADVPDRWVTENLPGGITP